MRLIPPRFRFALLAILFFGALGIAHQGRMFWTGEVPYGEFFQYLPNAAVTAEALRGGEMPLWNPYQYCGLPHMASHHAAALYPPLWVLFLLLNPFRAFLSMQALHFAWAGLGACALLRRGWGLTRTAALLGGVLFMVCGFMTAHVGHAPIIWAAAWLPWLLLCARLVFAGVPWAAPALAAGLMLHIAAGYMQLTVMFCLVMGAESLWLAWAQRDMAGNRIALKRLGLVAAGMALGIGLMSVQFLATREALTETARAHISFELFADYGLGLPQLALLLFPGALGSGWDFTFGGQRLFSLAPRPWFGPFEMSETLAPISAAVLLGLLCLALLPRPAAAPRRGDLRFWAGVALFSFLCLFGATSPLNHLLYHLPVLNLFRIQTRWLFFFSLALVLLAASGYDRLARGLHEPDRLVRARLLTVTALGAALALAMIPALYAWMHLAARHSRLSIDWADYFGNFLNLTNPSVWVPVLFVAAGVLLLLACLWRPAGVRWALLGIAGLGFAEQTLLHWQLIPQHGERWADYQPTGNGTLAWLDAHAPARRDYRLFTLFDDDVRQGAGTLALFSAALARIDSATGYWPMMSPVYGSLLRMNLLGVTSDTAGLLQRHAILDMLNIRYILIGHGWDGHELGPSLHPERKPRLVREIGSGTYSNLRITTTTPNGDTIVENTTALPRAWLVQEAILITSASYALARIWDGANAWSPARQALLEDNPSARAFITRAGDPLASGTVRVESRTMNHMRLTAEVTQPDHEGLVILSEAWHPGWRATVNGVPTAILRANAVLRAIPVRGGINAIELTYAPPGYRRGLLLTLVFLAAWLAWTATVLARTKA